MRYCFSIILTGFGLLTLVGCSPGFSALNSSDLSSSESYLGGSGKISISWSANREAAVNSTGGGYRVYYTQNSSLSSSTPFVDVPYASGSSAPTTAKIDGVISGTYHIYVVAYSAFKKEGSGPSTSAIVNVQ